MKALILFMNILIQIELSSASVFRGVFETDWL